VLRLLADQLRRYPSAFGFALQALDFYLNAPVEIAIVGDPDDGRLAELVRVVGQTYIPNRVIALCTEGFEKAAVVVPLLRDRDSLATQPTAFVCEGYTCKTPVHAADELLRQLMTRANQA
jgi:uncharacterized protein YyaL (SSP411 family)